MERAHHNSLYYVARLDTNRVNRERFTFPVVIVKVDQLLDQRN